MTRLRYMNDLYLQWLTATGMALSVLPALNWPNVLTVASALIGIAVGLSTLWLRRRQHRTQSRIEHLLEVEQLKDHRVEELQKRLARYEPE